MDAEACQRLLSGVDLKPDPLSRSDGQTAAS
jgi:hypothetical protein